ncbi:hypothetical protein Hte_005874 [Hypoxylon texense]
MATLDVFNPVLVHRRQGKALVFCANPCCVNIVRNTVHSVKSHILECQPSYPIDQLELVTRRLHEGGVLINEDPAQSGTFLTWLNDVVRFDHPIDPIPNLPDFDVIGCPRCSYGVVAMNKMNDHFRACHPGADLQGREAYAQIFQSGKTTRYVQITTRSQTPRTTVLSLRKLLDDDEVGQDETATNAQPNREPNMWLERLQFAQHVHGRNLRVMSSLVALDDAGAPALQLVKHLSTLCFTAQGLLSSQANLPLLIQLNRRRHDNAMTTPFTYGLLQKSFAKYMTSWRHVVAYVIRIYSWHDLPETAGSCPCVLTDEQRQAVSNVLALDWETADIPDKDATVMDFVWVLCKHELRHAPFDSAIVSACAMLSINPVDLSFHTCLTYNSTHFSSIVKVFLMVVYMRAVGAVGDLTSDHPPQKPTWSRLMHTHPRYQDELHAVTSMMDGVMYVGGKQSSMTTMTWVVYAQLVSREARDGAEKRATVEWSTDGKLKLVSNDTITSLPSMHKLMTASVTRTAATLGELLFQAPRGSLVATEPFVFDTPTPPAAEISDDKNNGTYMYSFLRHPGNAEWVRRSELFLLNKIDADQDLKKRWSNGNTISGEAIKAYRRAVDRFRIHLALAIHLTSGQPARRTEHQILRWQNSRHGQIRNLMVCNGRVGVRSLWYKRRWTSRVETPIWRFLPTTLGDAYVTYVSVVMPFLKCLVRFAEGPGSLSYFLYSRDVVVKDVANAELIHEDKLLSAPMSELSLETWGFNMNLAQYRHVAIAYSRRFLHGRDLETILSAQREDGDERYYSEKEKDIVGAVDAQAAHSSAVANAVYAVEYDTAERYHLFFDASSRWHLVFGLEPTLRGTKRPRDDDDDDDDAAGRDPTLIQQATRLSTLHNKLNDESLRLLLRDSSASLRPHQKKLFRALEEADVVVCVEATGAGKSVYFGLPAFVEPGGCTVVIQPTKALQQHTYHSLADKSVNVVTWDSSAPPQTLASIVLVTPEAMGYKEWRSFVQRGRMRREIDRVVLDEAHDVLLSDEGWRPRIREIRASMDFISQRQMFITGTLPPTLEDEFLRRLDLHRESPTLRLLRGVTVRNNIRYDFADSAEQGCDVPSFVRSMAESVSRAGKRFLVFSRSKSDCDARGLLLDIPSYHADTAQVDKKMALDKWNSAKGGLSATTALAYGIDYPDVSLVVCFGAFDMLTLCQQFGRAGRDGQPAVALLVADRTRLSGDLKTFALAKCKRGAISSYLDGVNVTCAPHHNCCPPCLSAHVGTAAAAAPHERIDSRPYMQPSHLARPHDSFTTPSQSNYLPDPSNSPRVFSSMATSTKFSPMDMSPFRTPTRPVAPKLSDVQPFGGAALTVATPYGSPLFRGPESRVRIELAADRQRVDSGSPCPLCSLTGASTNHHYLKNCSAASRDVVPAFNALINTLRDPGSRTRLERFSACFTCGAPQAFCRKWSNDPDRPTKCPFKLGFWELCSVIIVRYADLFDQCVIELGSPTPFSPERVSHGMLGAPGPGTAGSWIRSKVKVGDLETSNLFVTVAAVLEKITNPITLA